MPLDWGKAANRRILHLFAWADQCSSSQRYIELLRAYRMCTGTRSVSHSKQTHRSTVLPGFLSERFLVIIAFYIKPIWQRTTGISYHAPRQRSLLGPSIQGTTTVPNWGVRGLHVDRTPF